MDQDVFTELIKHQLAHINTILLEKQQQYATEDKLHNFRIAAELQDCTMEQALAGMLSKHTVSIYDMIATGKQYPTMIWDEKITDHIVYLLLLRTIIHETNYGKENTNVK